MPVYEVTLIYRTTYEFNIKADSEAEAIDIAQSLESDSDDVVLYDSRAMEIEDDAETDN